jgi:hypothetical protein
MNRFKAFLKLILIMGTAMTITACSKTVQWEEEVPLNTGEVIWVKRSMTYSRSGSYANPLKPSWSIESEAIEFEYKKEKYSWKSDQSPRLLAISPESKPTIIGNAADSYSWGDRHGYKCVKPYYVQYVHQKDGAWTWPSAIEPWLYNLPTNLMGYTTEPDAMPARVTSVDRARLDTDPLSRYSHYKKIDPNFIPDYCKGRI